MFKFGPPFNPEELFDREREVATLVNSMKSLKEGARKDYALIGVRRIGKTSILNKAAIEGKKASSVPVLLDCEGLTLEMLAREYGAAVLDALFEKEGLINKLKIKVMDGVRGAPANAIRALSELAGRTESLGIKVANDYLELAIRIREKQEVRKLEGAELFDYIEKTINLPEQLAKKHGVFFTIMLDEFQTTAAYSKPDFDFFAVMRRNTQKHQRTNYVLCGSNIGLMKNIVLSPDNPFGANFLIEWINPFDAKTSKGFLQKGFAEARARVNEEAQTEIIAFTGGHPAYLNWFGEQCVKLKRVTKKEVAELEGQFLSPSGAAPFFEKELAKIQKTTETNSVAILRIAAKEDIYSATEIAKRLGGITPGNVVNYLRRLESYGYLQRNDKNKYEFVDPMLKKYLKNSR